MKSLKTYLFMASVILFIFCILPQTGMALDRDTEKTINDMKQTIHKLEDRIKTLEKDKDEYLEEDLEEIFDRLDTVERKTLMDKLSFGAETRVRWDYFTYKVSGDDPYGPAFGPADEKTDLWSARFRLNMRADVSRKLKFNGRLTMYQNWADVDWEETVFARYRSGTDLKVERFYADYFFDFAPIALTIGRLPMADGLPTNLRENTPRKSTYPGVIWDTEADGIGLSVGLDKLTRLPGSAFRMVYVVLTYDNDKVNFIFDNDVKEDVDLDDITAENPDSNDVLFEAQQSSVFYRSEDGDKNTFPVYLFQLETGLSGILQDTMVMLGLIWMPNIIAPSEAMVKGLLVEKGYPVLDVEMVENPHYLGSMESLSLYIESARFLKSPVDWFASYTYQWFPPNEPAVYDITIDGIGTMTRTIGFFSDVAAGTYEKDTRTAWGVYLGCRIHIPVELLNTPKIGLEYNTASRDFFPKQFCPEDPLMKLSTVGTAWDIYYLQPIDDNFYFRIGHTIINKERDPSQYTLTEREEIDRELTNTYFLMDIKF